MKFSNIGGIPQLLVGEGLQRSKLQHAPMHDYSIKIQPPMQPGSISQDLTHAHGWI
jgi:hypothetical protein